MTDPAPPMRPGTLRRPIDRAEDLVGWLLTTMAVVAVLVAVLVGQSVHTGLAERARTAAADRTEVVAALVEDTPAPDYLRHVPEAAVAATWTGPDGRVRIGEIRVRDGLRAGETVPLWIGRDGMPTLPPAGAVDVVLTAVLAGVLVLGASFVLLYALWVGTQRLTIAVAVHAWERQWREIEPQWRLGKR